MLWPHKPRSASELVDLDKGTHSSVRGNVALNQVCWRDCEIQKRLVCGYLAIRNAAAAIGLEAVLPREDKWKVGISSSAVQQLLDAQPRDVRDRVHVLDSPGALLFWPSH